MENPKKPIAILNLTGDFLQELTDYFVSRNMVWVDPLENPEEHDWTHIITKDIYDFSLINKTYGVSTSDRHIISLSKVEDLQNFTINNGNLIIDDWWFKSPMSGFIMDKYFQNYGGMALGDNYPTFKEIGSFNIANPFNTGEYLDQLVHAAYEVGVDALSIKTYFDHLIMYATGLKKKSKAGLPFEVSYGVFDNVFGVQLHFSAKQLNVLDVSTSLKSSLSKKPEEYYLNVAVQSSDFFDFSFIPDVNKVIVTGLWTKDERIKFENRGLMFASISGIQSITNYVNHVKSADPSVPYGEVSVTVNGIEPGTVVNGVDLSTLPLGVIKALQEGVDPVTLLNGLDATSPEYGAITSLLADGLDLKSIVLDKLSPNAKSSLVSSSFDIPDLTSRVSVSGSLSEENTASLIKNFETKQPSNGMVMNSSGPGMSESGLVTEMREYADEAQLIKGGGLLGNLVSSVKEKMESEKESFSLPGNKIDIDKVASKIAALIDQSAEDQDIQVRSLAGQLQKKIKTGLFEFAKNENKSVDELNDVDLNNFETQKVPELIRDELLSAMVKDKSEADVKLQERIKFLETQLEAASGETDNYKFQVKKLSSEVKGINESRDKVKEIQRNAAEVTNAIFSGAKPTGMASLISSAFSSSESAPKNNRGKYGSYSDDDSNTPPNNSRGKYGNPTDDASEAAAKNSRGKYGNHSDDDYGSASASSGGNNGSQTVSGGLAEGDGEPVKAKVSFGDDEAYWDHTSKKGKKSADGLILDIENLPDITPKKDPDEELRLNFLTKLQTNQTLTAEDIPQLTAMLQRESGFISQLKDEEFKSRKNSVEAQHKESSYVEEIENSDQKIKSKDVALIKTKETFTKTIEKKEKEVNLLKSKVEHLTKTLATQPGATQVAAIKQLEKDNLSLARQVEFYKDRVSSLSNNMENAKKDDTDRNEVRRLQMNYQHAKNQIEQTRKEAERLQAKTLSDTSQMARLRMEKNQLEQQLKKASLQLKKQSKVAPVVVQDDQEIKQLLMQNESMENQLKEYTSKIENLESKLADAIKPKTEGSAAVEEKEKDNVSKVKVGQLEGTVKKLSKDLTEVNNQLGESKKEVNKLKQEKTSLQNQLDKLKKESEKNKPAAPKKPGGMVA